MCIKFLKKSWHFLFMVELLPINKHVKVPLFSSPSINGRTSYFFLFSPWEKHVPKKDLYVTWFDFCWVFDCLDPNANCNMEEWLASQNKKQDQWVLWPWWRFHTIPLIGFPVNLLWFLDVVACIMYQLNLFFSLICIIDIISSFVQGEIYWFIHFRSCSLLPWVVCIYIWSVEMLPVTPKGVPAVVLVLMCYLFFAHN